MKPGRIPRIHHPAFTGYFILLACLAFLLAACASEPGETPTAAQEATPVVETYPEPTAEVPAVVTYPFPLAVEGYPGPATGQAYPGPAEQPAASQAPGAVALESLPNQCFLLPLLAQVLPEYGSLVQLSEGRFEQLYPDAASGVKVNFVQGQTGDLNGDGLEDALAILAVNTGGSGTFIHLAALLASDGEARPLAAVPLGDRVLVKALNIQDGQAVVKMLTQGVDDPMCCPSEEVTRTFVLSGDQLLTPEQAQVAPLAEQAIQALRDQDMATLAAMSDSEAGLRFSPYAYVLEEHLAFQPEQLIDLLNDPTVYTWGSFDGSGEPIEMTFADYFQRFVYSKDFAAAEMVSFDQRLSTGNTLDNSAEFYPGAVVVEYHLPGTDPQYGGMDWQSLRLVFVWNGSEYRLAGIIHDEWTT